MGGLMAGRVLSEHQRMEQEQTQAMQEMAQGGGYQGGYGGYRPPPPAYGYGPPPPAYGYGPPPPAYGYGYRRW
jgi:hypothetical protein